MRRLMLALLGSLSFPNRKDTQGGRSDSHGLIAISAECLSIALAGLVLVIAVPAFGIPILEIVMGAVRIHPFEPSPPGSSLPSNSSEDSGRPFRFAMRNPSVGLNGVAMASASCVMGYLRIFERPKYFSLEGLMVQRFGIVRQGETRRKVLISETLSISSLPSRLIPHGRKTPQASPPSLILLFCILTRLRCVAGDMLITSRGTNLVGGAPYVLNWTESNTIPLIKDLVSFEVAIGVGDNSGDNVMDNYLMEFGPVAINSTDNVVGPMSYELKTGVPSDLGPDASTYFFYIISQLRLNMSVEVVNFSDHFSFTGMNGTFDTPENAILSRPDSPPTSRLFLCQRKPCDSSVALNGLALSSPTSTSAPPYTDKGTTFPAWSIVLIIVAVGWLLGFVGFIIYRRRHPFCDDPEGSSRPAKWWNKLPLPKFGALELPAGQGKYDSAELAGSTSNPIYELPAENIQRDIQYHEIPRKDTSEIEVLGTSNNVSVSEQPESPAQSECADTAVTFEVSISRESGDTTLMFRSPSPPPPENWRPLSPTSPEDISPHESTPMLSPNLEASSSILAPTPTSPTNEVTTFTLPEISISPPTLSPIPSPKIEAAEPPMTKELINMSRDQTSRIPTPPSIVVVESKPKPTIPPRPIRYRRNETAAKEIGPVLPAPSAEIELSSLTQISQLPLTPSRPVPPIPPTILETPSPTAPLSERELSPPLKLLRPLSLPPRPLLLPPRPNPSQIIINQTPAPSMGEQELAALAGAFAPPPPPPKPNSPTGNWVYK